MVSATTKESFLPPSTPFSFIFFSARSIPFLPEIPKDALPPVISSRPPTLMVSPSAPLEPPPQPVSALINIAPAASTDNNFVTLFMVYSPSEINKKYFYRGRID